MATSKVEIWNLALSAVGSRGSISDPLESGPNADRCRLWYPLILDNVLRAAPWPSTKTSVSLALLATRDFNEDWSSSDPAPGWTYAYGVPADMLAPIYLAGYAPFDLALWGDTRSIVTNQENAVLTYLTRQEDPTQWDSGLTTAVVYALAAALAMPITGKRTLSNDLRNIAQEAILMASTAAANETDVREESLASWIESRGYSDPPVGTQFIWPFAALSTTAV